MQIRFTQEEKGLVVHYLSIIESNLLSDGGKSDAKEIRRLKDRFMGSRVTVNVKPKYIPFLYNVMSQSIEIMKDVKFENMDDEKRDVAREKIETLIRDANSVIEKLNLGESNESK